MRIKRELTVVAALATAGALAASSSALARDANSTATAKFCIAGKAGCKTNTGKTPKVGKLRVHTHTNYTGSGTKTDRARLYFDNQIVFRPNAVPKCSATLAGLTMAQAMAACKNSLVGSGRAKATASTYQDTNACVLAFNAADGNPNRDGNQPGISLLTRAKIIGPITCGSPATNTQGDATVLLQAPLTRTTNQNPATVFKNGGKNLDFANIATASAFPLNDFNVVTGRGARYTRLTGAKAKFIQAKCSRTTGTKAKKWYLRTRFTYTTGTPIGQTVNQKPQRCR